MQQSWNGLLNYTAIASASPLASSAALTDISPTPQLVLPANYLQIGQRYRLRAAGVFSNTATPTLLLGFYVGGIAGAAIGASGAITTITAATNWSWIAEIEFQVRAIGSSGSIFPYLGRLQMPASLTQFQADYAIPATAPAGVTVDTTAAKALTVGAQWGASSASNTITCNAFDIEQLN
jgi:hypothetical protein